MESVYLMAIEKSRISPVGFGAFKIGRNQKTKYQTTYELPDEREVAKLLNGVLDAGVTYIDTAPAYGLSEERIGLSISNRYDEFVLSTKVGETFDDGRSTYDFSADAVRNSIERSLQRLHTEVLDLVFVHSDGHDQVILNETDVVPTLLELRDQGKIKSVGFSGYTEHGFQASLDWADAIMVAYHLDDTSLTNVMADADHRGRIVIVKKGLDSGKLDPSRAIEFVLSNPHVTSLVIGGLNLDHLRANIRVAKGVRESK
jgi:aryl-alcohol dehydrogenase-like predicted oxidoreductase